MPYLLNPDLMIRVFFCLFLSSNRLVVNFRFSILLGFLLLLISSHKQHLHFSPVFVLAGKAQGTSYVIKYRYPAEVITSIEIDSLFQVFDHSLSRYNKQALLTKLNKSKQRAKLDSHLVQVIHFAQATQIATKGCFDYKLLPLVNLWGFGSRNMSYVPDSSVIRSLLHQINAQSLQIIGLRAIKSHSNLKLDLDGIAQGYCVDQLSSFLFQKGIKDFIIELGGEVYVTGYDSQNRPWQIGIENHITESANQPLVLAGMDKVGITTSGSLQKFKKIGDRYFSHIIDPRTGYPVQNNIVSVTVIAPNVMQADALDNAFMVMGIKESFEWTKNMPEIGMYFSYFDVNGDVADTANAYFKQFLQKEQGN